MFEPEPDLWPCYPNTSPLLDPDVPAPAAMWRCLVRHAQFLDIELAEVTAQFGRALLEARPCEGSA